MRPEWNYEIVDPIAGVIRRQYNCLVLPVVLLCVTVAAVLANLHNK